MGPQSSQGSEEKALAFLKTLKENENKKEDKKDNKKTLVHVPEEKHSVGDDTLDDECLLDLESGSEDQ